MATFESLTTLATYTALSRLIAGRSYYALLVGPSFALDKVNHRYVSDIAASEVSGSGYSRKQVTGVAAVETSVGADLVCDALVWDALDGVIVGGVVIYELGSNDSDSMIIGFFDTADVTTNGTKVSFYPPNGVFASINLA